MSRTTIPLGVALASLAYIAVISGVFGFRIDRVTGFDAVPQLPLTDATLEQIADTLRQAGLNETPVLGDTAISGHLERMAKAQVSAAQLVSYADHLQVLRGRTHEKGAEIPPSFWDVDTPALRRDGWTSYKIVAELAKDQNARHLDILARCYARFKAFKSNEVDGTDTALSAAFDMLAMVRDHVDAYPEGPFLRVSDRVAQPYQEALLIWQNIVIGSIRKNPITGIAIYDHGFLSRFNVPTIYQYDIGQPMGVGETWGVSGFAPRFVGTSSNSNQIEHLSISLLLLAAFDEPLVVLEAIEIEKSLTGAEAQEEAKADMALNKAIHEMFLPLFRSDPGAAENVLYLELTR